VLGRLCLAVLCGCAASTPDVRPPDSRALLERMDAMQERVQFLEAEKARTDETMVRTADRIAALAERVVELEGAQAKLDTHSAERSETKDRARRRTQAPPDDDDPVIGAEPAKIITREVVSSKSPTSAPSKVDDACATTLSSACAKARDASKGNCLICAGSHADGCASSMIDDFCNGKDRRRLKGAAQGSSVAEQMNVQCTDASLSADDCVPECGNSLHGYLLLLNIGGNDSKLSCELHYGLYSWVGAAVRFAHPDALWDLSHCSVSLSLSLPLSLSLSL
jgi:TolA-binding protein